MKSKIILLLSILFISFQMWAQAPCPEGGTIIINGEEIDAVSFDNNDKAGLKLPMWLNAGATLAAGQGVNHISVIEFNEESQSSGGNSLVYNRVLIVGVASQTVPANKVWKMESITKTVNPFAQGRDLTSNSPVCEGDNLNLTAPTVLNATYSWIGPNGFTSASQNPTIAGVTLAAAGDYTASIALNGCLYQKTETVVVDTVPNSNFTTSPYPTANYNVTFYPDVPGMSYAWTFNGGTPGTDNVENPVVQWGTSNNYDVTLVATDGNGCSSTTLNSVTIHNCQANQPESDFTWSPATAGYSTTFTPNDLSATSYSWTFDQGTSAMTTDQIPNDVVWATASNYNVTLVTTFAGGCYTTTQSVTVSNCQIGQPESDFSWSIPAVAGNNVTFTPDDLSALTYTWVFDQGTSTMTTDQIPTDVVWPSGGSYDVTLVTTFAGGCYLTTKTINVFNGMHTFTNCGQTGQFGPSQGQCDNEDVNTALNGQVAVNNGIQEWVAPVTGIYRFEVSGAGLDSYNYQKGAVMNGEIHLNQGDVLKILVGQVGLMNRTGSGGSFVTLSDNTPLIIAGGSGGGAANLSSLQALTSTSGNGGNGGTGGDGGVHTNPSGPGGGGLLTNGTGGGGIFGVAFINGGDGGLGSGGGEGGFGGGAGYNTSSSGRSGGGGGYSGGGGSTTNDTSSTGGGGGSYIAPFAANVSTSDGNYDGSSTFNGNPIINLNSYNSGHGQVIIYY